MPAARCANSNRLAWEVTISNGDAFWEVYILLITCSSARNLPNFRTPSTAARRMQSARHPHWHDGRLTGGWAATDDVHCTCIQRIIKPNQLNQQLSVMQRELRRAASLSHHQILGCIRCVLLQCLRGYPVKF